MKRRKHRPTLAIREKPLGFLRTPAMRRKGVVALGMCYRDRRLILIESRQEAHAHLDTLIHELLHFYLPELSETRVARVAHRLRDGVWALRYRRLAL